MSCLVWEKICFQSDINILVFKSDHRKAYMGCLYFLDEWNCFWERFRCCLVSPGCQSLICGEVHKYMIWKMVQVLWVWRWFGYWPCKLVIKLEFAAYWASLSSLLWRKNDWSVPKKNILTCKIVAAFCGLDAVNRFMFW